MMLLLTSVLLLTTVHCSPLPRDADHYFNTKELWARRRALFTPANLPTALRLQAAELVDQSSNEILSNLADAEDEDLDTLEKSTSTPTTTGHLKEDTESTKVTKKIKKIKKMKIAKQEDKDKPFLQDVKLAESSSPLAPSLDYYYQYIDRSFVDQSARGGAPFATSQCCHEVRTYGGK